MLRSGISLGLLTAVAAAASGQTVNRPQTALAALGQVNVLGRAPSGLQPVYRTATRHGAAVNQPSVLGKPFSNTTNGPTVSPYLNLLREEENQGAPNYFTFVRPQMQQLEASRQQLTQLQQLRRQVQQTSYTRPVASSPGAAARYGDTGRYYSGWRR